MNAWEALLPAHAALSNHLQRPNRENGYRLHPAVLERVWLERLRQKKLFTARKIDFACDSPVVDGHRKLSVLTEEIGEVAKEVLEYRGRTRTEARRRLQDELTQVAAVSIAWLESIEVEETQ